MLFEGRVVYFLTKILSGREDSMRVGSEVWDYGNTTNSDECKTPGSDGEISNANTKI